MSIRKLIPAVALLVFSISSIASAVLPLDPNVPHYQCKHINKPINVDGRLNDAAWNLAKPVDFVLVQSGKATVRKTTAKMLWDNNYLYIGFLCEDPDIWGTLTGRDKPIFIEEVVETFIDPDKNPFDYYEIDVSPRNTLFDSVITNSTGLKPEPGFLEAWTCVGCRTAVYVNGTLDNRKDVDKYWEVEMAIPFTRVSAPIGKTPCPGDTWRINLCRIDLSPIEEFQAWSPTLTEKPDFHVPSRYGVLEFEE